jgi:3-deoxy-D-manno-octulosonate 8-phosphate phosphatase (KDO 8-P phosphatase)
MTAAARAHVRLLLMDVDGVLTRGQIIYGPGPLELKVFHVRDGMGITLARAAGLRVGILTGRTSEAVTRRCRELAVDIVVQNSPDKKAGYEAIKREHHYADEEIAYIGDDIQDIPVLQQVGIPLGVRNSVPEVKQLCTYVAAHDGGDGAVREIIEWILERQDRKREAVAEAIRQMQNAVPVST